MIKNAVTTPSSPFYHSSWERLAEWTDTFGPRLWGSQVLEMAIDDLYNQARA